MRKSRTLLIITLLLTGLSACNNQRAEDEFRGLKVDALINFGRLPEVAENPENPITEAKVQLGQTLFYDKRLSKNQTQSCNTCHNLSSFGVDGRAKPIGDDGVSLGKRNAPTVLNAALFFRQFWDGRAADVEEQAGMPILNDIEMGIPDEGFLVERLKKIEGYEPMFAEAFPDAQDPLTFENIRLAIAAFERKLITPSRFDEYMAGDESALSDEEKRGLSAFIGLRCVNCHTTTTFGGSMYERRGFFNNFQEVSGSSSGDLGRFEVTGVPEDTLMFKVPTLRNIEHTAPYFHDGQVFDLREAIRIMGKAQLDHDLSEKQIDRVEGFLKTLSGSIPAKYKIAPPMPK